MSEDINPTGIEPVEYKILIKVEEIEQKSSGGIYLPETTLGREQSAHDRGTLIAISSMAFDGWEGTIPKVGDKIIFKKYAGTVIQHRGEASRIVGQYRLCHDKDICAIIKEA